MIVTTLQNLDQETAQELIAVAMGSEDNNPKWERMLGLVGNGVEVAVLSCEVEPCEGDPRWRGYYNIAFSDGTVIDAVAGLHLRDIANWK